MQNITLFIYCLRWECNPKILHWSGEIFSNCIPIISEISEEI